MENIYKVLSLIVMNNSKLQTRVVISRGRGDSRPPPTPTHTSRNIFSTTPCTIQLVHLDPCTMTGVLAPTHPHTLAFTFYEYDSGPESHMLQGTGYNKYVVIKHTHGIIILNSIRCTDNNKSKRNIVGCGDVGRGDGDLHIQRYRCNSITRCNTCTCNMECNTCVGVRNMQVQHASASGGYNLNRAGSIWVGRGVTHPPPPILFTYFINMSKYYWKKWGDFLSIQYNPYNTCTFLLYLLSPILILIIIITKFISYKGFTI